MSLKFHFGERVRVTSGGFYAGASGVVIRLDRDYGSDGRERQKYEISFDLGGHAWFPAEDLEHAE